MFRNVMTKTIKLNHCKCRYYVRGRGKMPGLNNQLKAMPELKNEIDKFEDIGEFESDFSHAHESHKMYQKETEKHLESVKQKLVAQKYFQKTHYNFLTWAEKEQIRQLHQKDPNEWTAERLSESFPTDFGTVKKLLKATWQPTTDKRILKHDEAVRKTWEKFYKNELEQIDNSVKDHLQKFTYRKHTNQQKIGVNYGKKEMPKPSTNEFSSIITSCKAYTEESPAKKPEESEVDLEKRRMQQEDVETFLLGKIQEKKMTQFNPFASNKVIPSQEIIFNNPDGTGVKAVASATNMFNVKKYDSQDQVQISTEQQLQKLSMPAIRNFIRIPKKLYKEGATYKIKDCYYDDDGEFLYRVPGMSQN